MVRNMVAAQAAAGMAFLMNKSLLGASLGAQNGSKTVMMAKATRVVKKAAQQVASKVGGGSAKGFRRYQGACTLPGCWAAQGVMCKLNTAGGVLRIT